MSAVGARLLDISGVVKVRVMLRVSILVSMWMSMLSRIEMAIWMNMGVRAIWMRQMGIASVFDIPRANAGVADFLIRRSGRNSCSMAYYTCFPAYVG